MEDNNNNILTEKIRQIEERLVAIEKEQRLIREDILSGEADMRMKKRILDNPKKYNKKDIEEKIGIKI